MKTNTTTTARSYTIKRNSAGYRFIHLASGNIIPADIAAVCTGKDKWLSEIVCKCRDCKQPFPLSQLQGGGQWCEDCATSGIED